jgi:hypothetical protein
LLEVNQVHLKAVKLQLIHDTNVNQVNM